MGKGECPILAINTINFAELKLHALKAKHTYVLQSPNKTIRQGVVFKFQRGRIPQPGDVVHVTVLHDDTSRVAFDRQVLAIQRKSEDYHLYMDSPPELRLNMDDDGCVSGCAIYIDADGEQEIVNQHSVTW